MHFAGQTTCREEEGGGAKAPGLGPVQGDLDLTVELLDRLAETPPHFGAPNSVSMSASKEPTLRLDLLRRHSDVPAVPNPPRKIHDAP